MSAHRFRSTELTRAIKATREAGVTDFDVTFDHDGRPIIKVRSGPANDGHDVDDEIDAWIRAQSNAA